MKKSSKQVVLYIVGAVLLVLITAGSIFYASDILKMLRDGDELYVRAEDMIEGYIRDRRDSLGDGSVVPGEKRLSQKVTITRQNSLVPIGGTVTKSSDAFYPGTYEVKFTKTKILNSKATIYLNIDVEPGQTVYVLVGDKELGYKNFATIEAADQNTVAFETNVIRDYTVSTTDIIGAQKAMEVLLSCNK